MDPSSQAGLSAAALFGALGIVFWGWLIRRFGYNRVDLAMDPKGFGAMLLVMAVATAVFGMMLLDGLGQAFVYLTSRPLLLVVLAAAVAGGLYALWRRRQYRGWNGL